MGGQKTREKTRTKTAVEKNTNKLLDKNAWLLLFSVSNILRHGLWYSEDLMQRRERDP